MQDFFEAGILPADTDFRMMSAKYFGELPGLDIAFLLDSGAYHMLADVPERIRPGTLQVTLLCILITMSAATIICQAA